MCKEVKTVETESGSKKLLTIRNLYPESIFGEKGIIASSRGVALALIYSSKGKGEDTSKKTKNLIEGIISCEPVSCILIAKADFLRVLNDLSFQTLTCEFKQKEFNMKDLLNRYHGNRMWNTMKKKTLQSIYKAKKN